MTIAAATASPRIEVDPRILSVIGDPSAPRGTLRQPVVPPASLPGRIGLLANAFMIGGSTLRGAEFAAAMHRKYGEIFRWSYGREHIVFVSDIDTVQRILRNEDGLWSCAMGWDSFLFGRIEPEGGNSGGLASLDFEAHRAARRLMQPAFTPRAIKGYVELVQPLIRRAVASWVAHGKVNFKDAARSLLADVANTIFTGIEAPPERARLDRALRAVWSSSSSLLDQERLSPGLREGRRAWRELNHTFTALVAERSLRPGRDMLSQLVLTRESGTDAALAKGFLALMLAAYDTTSAAVTSMAYLLAKHPHWQEQLRAEATQCFDGDPGNLPRLERHDWAWKETLRLMPVAGFLPRRNLRDVELLGHRLPAGCMVGAVVGPVGRDARYWEDPERFDPARFSPARAEDKRRSNQYAPFGAGVHACIGSALSGMEAKLLFAELLPRCRFSLRKDYQAHHQHTPIGIVSGDVALRLEPLG